MNRYFFNVDYRPYETDPQLLAGRCISVLHGFMIKHSTNGIGLSFPDWTDQFMGHSIAFVGPDKDLLGQLSRHPYFTGMLQAGFFTISAVQPVPADAREVRFVRNQGLAKCFAGEKRRRLARAKRRAEARGEVFDPSQLALEREVDHFHRARLDSSSNGQRFVLHIQKQEAGGVIRDGFNRYGLATNDVWRGTVPELTPPNLNSR